MDNRIFNINGKGVETLTKVLGLALGDSGAKGWEFVPAKGFLLFTYGECANKFPSALDATTVAPMVHQWLDSAEAMGMPCDGWDADQDHDGDNERGWRVYVEDWGHVDDRWGVACAIRPAFMWYGK